jgi:expansin (peptidoglycan-binding protein)
LLYVKTHPRYSFMTFAYTFCTCAVHATTWITIKVRKREFPLFKLHAVKNEIWWSGIVPSMSQQQRYNLA